MSVLMINSFDRQFEFLILPYLIVAFLLSNPVRQSKDYNGTKKNLIRETDFSAAGVSWFISDKKSALS